MRVLFVTNTFPPDYTGGAEVSLYHTCQGLMQAGVVCSVIALNNRRLAREDCSYDLDGIPVHRIYFGERWPWQDVLDRRLLAAVRAEIRRRQPDLVHVHNVSGASLAPFVACRLEGAPVVSTLHDLWLICANNMLYRRDGTVCRPQRSAGTCGRCLQRFDYWADVPYRRRVFAALTANVRRFISPSQALIDRHVEAGYEAARFRRVPHGMREPVARPPSPAAHRRPTLVYAGGGVVVKGAEVLLAAIPAILRAVEDVQLLVAGGGSPGRLIDFRRAAGALGASRVQVLGQVSFDQMAALYGAADLTLFPSIWPEAFSMVIYESFQMGAPAVGSALGAVPELIAEGVTGYLFPPGDSAALAARVAEHFARPSHERRRMRHACLDYVRRTLSLEKHVSSLLEVYREALGVRNS
jgi:glycosyltransferase involved in cell wall biosynthesis